MIKFLRKIFSKGKNISLEEKIYNQGERLVPAFMMNDPWEITRHQSSYEFFRRIIKEDLNSRRFSKKGKITIIDLGCGVGHGCVTLSSIPNSHITGVDIDQRTIDYAKDKYQRPNITYKRVNLTKFISAMPEFDYVVSRGVLEHIKSGLKLARVSRWHYRLIFDVPYDEPAGRNPHHLLVRITEKDFLKFPRRELFYEDLKGKIYDQKHKPAAANMILCVCSRSGLLKIDAFKIKFPIPAWRFRKEFIQKACKGRK